MHPKIHSFSQFSAYFVRITFLILAIFVFCSFSATLEEHYVNCAPLNSTCGDSLNITYPFWVSSRPSYCGHPAFKLDCQSNGFTILIKNQTFRVLSLNYASNTLAISKQAFSESLCPETTAEITNSSLDFTFFDFAPKSQNVTVLYNCSTARVSDTSYFIFGCPGNVFSHTIVSGINYIETREDKRALDKLKCRIKIVLPVLRSEVTKLSDRLDNVNDVASKGFEVSWKANQRECKVCLQSGGRCGYNETLRLPVCFCKDSVYPQACKLPSASQGHKGLKRSTVIWLGVGAATGGVILVCFLSIFLRHRYRKNQSTKQLDSKKEPSNTLSTAVGPNEGTYLGVKVFSFSELEEATNHFSPEKQIGKGGFGNVYHGTLTDGREVAIKRMYDRSNQKVEQFLNEVDILAKLRHRNLVTLYGCTSQQGSELLLVYEFISNGTCTDHLRGSKANLGLLTWPVRLNIAIETASALVYLHSSDVIHRDVKTQNILLDKDLSVKVGDFGISRLFPVDLSHVSTTPQGTPGYVDPEYYQYFQLTGKSDVYSFGVVLAELLSSKKVVDSARQRDDINLTNMFKNRFLTSAMDEFVDPLLGFENEVIKEEVMAVAEVIAQCLESTQAMRPSMEQVLEQLRSIRDKNDTTDSSEIVQIP